MSLLVFCSLRSNLEGKFPQHFTLFAQNVISQLCMRAFEGNYNSALFCSPSLPVLLSLRLFISCLVRTQQQEKLLLFSELQCLKAKPKDLEL